MPSPSASTTQTESSTHQTPTSTTNNPSSTTSPPPSTTPASSQTAPTDPHRTSLARTAFTTHLSALASSHLTPLQSRSVDISTNARSLAKQDTALSTKAVPGLKKEGDRLEKMGEKERGRLKELGDVQNWAEVLERDLLVLETAMALGEGEDLGDGWETEEEDEEEDGEGGDEGEGDDKKEGMGGRKKVGGKGGQETGDGDMMAGRKGGGSVVEAEAT